MNNLLTNRRTIRGTLLIAGLGAALTVFVACGGSGAKQSANPFTTGPARNATPSTANTAPPNVAGLNSSVVQNGITRAQQALIAAQNGQKQQSVSDEGVQSVAAGNSEILGDWHNITGNLENGNLSSSGDVKLHFNADGTCDVVTSSADYPCTFRALGGHEYGMKDAHGSGTVGVYVAGNYLFAANNNGVVLYSR